MIRWYNRMTNGRMTNGRTTNGAETAFPAAGAERGLVGRRIAAAFCDLALGLTL